ncbi:hypothetical protein [Deinococcus aerophilus]|uniref:hypothetical protein n=1 Tax=Deinococcus aerophilus TaxID=522488 RepID=UPI001E40272A|nr:hypothetical protein [Deinococcus aerophilus]
MLLAALLPLALGACRQPAQAGAAGEPSEDLVSRVLFTATGAYDAQADMRERIPGSLRRATWTTRPPLPAREIVVQYDSDARPLAWFLHFTAPQFTAQDLAGEGASTVQTPQGQGWRPAPGTRLADVLILPLPGGDMNVLTRGYVTQAEAALLPAFHPR